MSTDLIDNRDAMNIITQTVGRLGFKRNSDRTYIKNCAGKMIAIVQFQVFVYAGAVVLRAQVRDSKLVRNKANDIKLGTIKQDTYMMEAWKLKDGTVKFGEWKTVSGFARGFEKKFRDAYTKYCK